VPGLNWIQVAGGAVAAFALSFLLHTVDVNRIESNHRAEMAKQKTDLETAFAADKKLTEENSRAYQKQVSNLTRKLADAKRLLPSRCVVPVTGQASGGNRGATGGINARLDGVSSDALIDYAGECERYRLQVISLQDFINQVWEGKAP